MHRAAAGWLAGGIAAVALFAALGGADTGTGTDTDAGAGDQGERPSIPAAAVPAPEGAPRAGGLARPQPAPVASVGGAPPETATMLCGLGTMPLGPPPAGGTEPLEALPDPVGRWALQEAGLRLRQALAAGEPTQRLLAALRAEPRDGDAGATMRWADAVVALALADRDPQALRWAASACPQARDGPACRGALVRARVQAEPANALHWLDWAHEEPQSADAAWAGLQQARYWRQAPMALPAAVERALPADLPGYLRGSLLVEALNAEASLPTPPMDIVDERCGAGADAPGSSRCNALAHLLVEHSDAPAARVQGLRLAGRLGWPAPELQRLNDELQTQAAAPPAWPTDGAQPWQCELVEARARHVLQGAARTGSAGR